MDVVVSKFLIASMLMWALPIAIIYGFNHNLLFPTGSAQLSAESTTLLSGLVAVFSVNVVIALYIYSAMKEPRSSDKHQPDAKFLADAKASIDQHQSAAPPPEDQLHSTKKQE